MLTPIAKTFWNKMTLKTKKCLTIGTIPKSYTKIVGRGKTDLKRIYFFIKIYKNNIY
jgi:hypothetical protein